MRDAAHFLSGCETQDAWDVSPTMTVFDQLRTGKKLSGTEAGCSKGDRAARAVVPGGPAVTTPS